MGQHFVGSACACVGVWCLKVLGGLLLVGGGFQLFIGALGTLSAELASAGPPPLPDLPLPDSLHRTPLSLRRIPNFAFFSLSGNLLVEFWSRVATMDRPNCASGRLWSRFSRALANNAFRTRATRHQHSGDETALSHHPRSGRSQTINGQQEVQSWISTTVPNRVPNHYEGCAVKESVHPGGTVPEHRHTAQQVPFSD